MRFEFIHNDLGQRNKGEIVEVTLTMAANVQLMDSSNFANYRNGRKYRYIGGLAKQSPLDLSTNFAQKAFKSYSLGHE